MTANASKHIFTNIDTTSTIYNTFLFDIRWSISPLLQVINEFGQFSGFAINWEKSVLMPLSDGFDKNILDKLPFKIMTEHFEYLGITIPRNPKFLFKLNFIEFLNKLRDMIDNWKLLSNSLIG